MPMIASHPTVEKMSKFLDVDPLLEPPTQLDAAWLRQLCLDCGADDVGFVSLDRPELAGERSHVLEALPSTRMLISFVSRLNREAVRSVNRSLTNLEFHHNYEHVNEIGRRIVRRLEDHGVRALNPSAGFPMEMDKFPGRIWVVSHKTVAVAAGLGQMGLHRCVIHPKFGSFISLGTILIVSEVTSETNPIDFNPCLDCRLCVAACPVGAISPEGHFNFANCATHNYREFMSGFSDWVEQVVESKDRFDYRTRMALSETASMWQSLSFGPNYKAAYCVAACPAGEDVILPYLRNKSGFIKEIVRPLQEKVEPVYVIKGSDAESHVKKRFPGKKAKVVRSGLQPRNAAAFIDALPLLFQPRQAKQINAHYRFIFSGAEMFQADVLIQNGKLLINPVEKSPPDVTIRADARTWLRFLSEEINLVWAVLTLRIRISGKLWLMKDFQKCFPT